MSLRVFSDYAPDDTALNQVQEEEHNGESPGGNKPMCVFYQTCVEKTQYLPVWVFPHMFGYFHTYVQ